MEENISALGSRCNKKVLVYMVSQATFRDARSVDRFQMMI